jgi:hypothetical protein
MAYCKRVSLLEFGQEMLTWKEKGTYPLEALIMLEFEDKNGIIFIPAIPNYATGDLIITGDRNGYSKRKDLLSLVGSIWDDAEELSTWLVDVL